MDPTIQKILQDLYAIDPTLYQYESRVISLISKLLASRPNVPLDRAFAARLRTELLNSARASNASRAVRWGMPRVRYMFAGITVFALGLGLVMYSFYTDRSEPGGGPVFAMHIEDAGENAFGTLKIGPEREAQDSSQDAPGPASKEGGGTSSVPKRSTIRSMSESGGGSLSSVPVPPSAAIPPPPTVDGRAGSGFGIGGDKGGDSIASPLIYPEIAYRFTYAGEPFTVDSKGSVYQRVKGSGIAGEEIAGILRHAANELFDANALSNPKLHSVELSEDRDGGYTVHANLQEGMVFISQQWETSARAGEELKPVGMHEVPADSVLIGTARDFIKKFGIDATPYGEPFVDNTWRDYMRAAGANMPEMYAPEAITIIYPLNIDDKEVYEHGGARHGLTVTVDTRFKNIVSVSNLMTHRYKKSDYVLETDTARLISIAEQVGTPIYVRKDLKIQTIKLGTPIRILVKHWITVEKSENELIIPALAFPVLDRSAQGSWLPPSIIVPLPKDILNEWHTSGVIDNPRLKPVLQGSPEAIATESGDYAAPILKARETLAQELKTDVKNVVILNAEKTEWPDACLGIVQDGSACAQVITPGYRVTFEAVGKKYEYRTNAEGSIIRRTAQ